MIKALARVSGLCQEISARIAIIDIKNIVGSSVMMKKSPILTKIVNAIKETGEEKSRPCYCSASEVFGPVTFGDLLGGARFPQSEGIYIIWGESRETRPLYVGMTTRGRDRPLAHLKGSMSESPIREIVRGAKPDCLGWTIFFCPLLGDCDDSTPWLSSVLLSFERKIAKSLNPWFWHGGLRGDPLDCPYVKSDA